MLMSKLCGFRPWWCWRMVKIRRINNKKRHQEQEIDWGLAQMKRLSSCRFLASLFDSSRKPQLRLKTEHILIVLPPSPHPSSQNRSVWMKLFKPSVLKIEIKINPKTRAQRKQIQVGVENIRAEHRWETKSKSLATDFHPHGKQFMRRSTSSVR